MVIEACRNEVDEMPTPKAPTALATRTWYVKAGTHNSLRLRSYVKLYMVWKQCVLLSGRVSRNKSYYLSYLYVDYSDVKIRMTERILNFG
jgi:hypothetical protein